MSALAHVRDGAKHGSAPDAATATLAALYQRVWGVCAGWNRKPFRSQQLLFIRRRTGLVTLAQALGSIEAMTTIFDDCRVVILNRLFLPRNSMSEEELFAFLGSRRGLYLRFVFLHELAHQLFHESPARRSASWADARRSGDVLWGVQREVEADFYALLAMVPDSTVAVQKSKYANRELLVDAIAERLGIQYSLDESHRCSIRDLAEYRLALFEVYSYAFVSVSASPFEESPGRVYRNVRTFDRDEEISEAPGPVDISQILMLHPYVRQRPLLQERLRASRAEPFDHVAAAASRTHTPLTHRMDPRKLLASAGLNAQVNHQGLSFRRMLIPH